MVYVQAFLAFLQALPELVKLGQLLVEKITVLAEETAKARQATEFRNALDVAKTKGDTSEIDRLLGKRPTPKP